MGSQAGGGRVLISMTGFGRAQCGVGTSTCSVEVSSVNRKNLDVQINLPRHLVSLEAAIIKLVRAHCARGRIQVRLIVELAGSERGAIAWNAESLKDVVGQMNALADDLGVNPLQEMRDVLTIPGLHQILAEGREVSGEDLERMVDCVGDALKELCGMRKTEGAALYGVLSAQVDQMLADTEKLKGNTRVNSDRVRERLVKSVEDMGVEGLASDARLLQEIAFYAEKGDITEEVDRLQSHLEQTKEKLSASEPIGRALDFLGQEIGREVNTICSKSQDLELTRIGLSLKETVDQFREQCLNVE